jgi:hypothetical protein
MQRWTNGSKLKGFKVNRHIGYAHSLIARILPDMRAFASRTVQSGSHTIVQGDNHL